MKAKGLLCLILMIVSLSSFAVSSVINNFIFFGDSLSDVGNNTWVKLDNIIGTPITNPNAQNIKSIWVNDLVEQKLHQPVYASSALHINPKMDNISYAFADATTINGYLNANWPQDNPPPPYVNSACAEPGVIKDAVGGITSTCVPGLQKQVDLYLNQVQSNPNPNTVFFIWSGANDLQNSYSSYLRSIYKIPLIARYNLPTQIELDKIAQLAVDNINAAKNKLIDAGVKPEKIYILNLPDLSRTPALLTDNSWQLKVFFGKKNIMANLRDLTKSFNDKLIQYSNDPKYKIPVTNYVPINHWFLQMISYPQDYQLSNVQESCIANHAFPECKGYLFYNEKHPTSYVFNMVANKIIKFLNSPTDDLLGKVDKSFN